MHRSQQYTSPDFDMIARSPTNSPWSHQSQNVSSSDDEITYFPPAPPRDGPDQAEPAGFFLT